MPTITTRDGLITQINVFDIVPGKQADLLILLTEAAESCRDAVPGWVSASLHLSLDGARLVNYAQAEDKAAMKAVFAHLNDGGWLERNRAFGVAHPGLYRVMRTLER
ncbi:antibiotic biosynthesis monooxygenase [Brevundimonas sp.]|uniref:antibiotic biosynthesis monooxygenase n=1 Tax=Brevundimonas sp. TaxID=1871086 RepID=UPI00286C1234|nr:antibiotic biosynthesis monooxygenase [Brevundimonas sp.]